MYAAGIVRTTAFRRLDPPCYYPKEVQEYALLDNGSGTAPPEGWVGLDGRANHMAQKATDDHGLSVAMFSLFSAVITVLLLGALSLSVCATLPPTPSDEDILQMWRNSSLGVLHGTSVVC